MKRTMTIVAAMAALASAQQAVAVPLGACYSEAAMRKELVAEGQSISKVSADKSVLLSLGAQDSGYVIEVRGASWCAVSVLQRVKNTIVKRDAQDICADPEKYPGAVKVCKELKGKVQFVGSVSAEAAKSALSPQMTGPVRVLVAFCRDNAGRQILCGRTETALE